MVEQMKKSGLLQSIWFHFEAFHKSIRQADNIPWQGQFNMYEVPQLYGLDLWGRLGKDLQ